ncbi:hypothetical protein [Sphingobacterium sp.]|uniref:hypothetical protein n=1 Tax=Sphingobacterium sp. TaxID=341027 RepID=UPI0031D5C5F4
MSKIAISIYKITVYKKGNTEELEHLNDYDSGNDLLDLVKTLPAQFRKINSENNVVEEGGTNRRTVIPDQDLEVSGRNISGYVKSGDYGFETPIINAKGDQVYNVSKEDSAMRPFFFFFNLPKDETTGYLLIQRFENFGVYTILSRMLKQVFAKKFSKYTLAIQPVGIDNSEAMAFLEEGKISKASFTIFDSENIASLFTNNNPNDQFEYKDVKAEITISAKKNKMVALKNTVINLLNNGKEAKIKLTDSDIPYERLKIYLKLGKEQKVLDLSKWDTFSKDIDITHKLDYDYKTGHPLVGALKQECFKILDQLNKES